MPTGHAAKRASADLNDTSPTARPTQRSRCDANSSGGSVQPPPALVIWDLDETLILFNSLVTGSPPFTPGTESARATSATMASASDDVCSAALPADRSETLRQRGAALGERMESLLWSLLDHIFDFEQLEQSEYASVADALAASGGAADSGGDASSDQSWLVGEGEADSPLRRRSMGAASQTPAQVYAQGFREIVRGYAGGQRWLEQQTLPRRSSSSSSRSAETAGERNGEAQLRPFCEGLAKLRDEINQATGGWDREARRVLASAADNGGENVLVTASHLVAAFGKLLLYNLDGFFPAESAVWSACRLSKTDIFVRVIQAHLAAHGHSEAARCYGVGSSTELLPRGFLAVVVGDGTEEEAAAQRLQLPFVKVCSASDLSKVGRYLAGRQPAPTAEQAA